MADKNRIIQLLDQGQSVWLDSIARGQLKSGGLKKLIDEDGIRGETANPSIFEKAIGGSSDYDEQIRELVNQGVAPMQIYERVASDDVRTACDFFRPLYDKLEGADGFVSLEVSPKLAHDTEGTLAEVRRFWKMVDRPNLMIKIPGTAEGTRAIEESLYEGINVNITLLFAVSAYEEVAWAYIRALERRLAEGKPINRIASVASFFVSRIDTVADKLLDEKIKQENDPQKYEELNDLKGKVAIANAKIAYERFQKIFSDPRFQVLRAHGARVQRPLWASTSTKNPAYPDTLYVDTLIGPDTINTLPEETIEAFKDHGHVERTVDKNVHEAHEIIQRFEAAGLSLRAVTDQVLVEGVQKFDEAFDKLLKEIEQKRDEIQKEAASRKTIALGNYAESVKSRLEEIQSKNLADRIWHHDASIWTIDTQHQEKIRDRLGWLTVARMMKEQVGALKMFTDEVISAGFKHVLLLGMGGSSLAPEVMQFTFGIGRGHPNFAVLDTTDPASVKAYLREMPPDDTLYIVSSKSGTTTETLSFYKYFYGQTYAIKGEKAGRSFVAITDPGTPLERLARQRGFRRIFTNPPDIGGRYSALSYFGLVPAALMGIDIGRLLDSAQEMMRACESSASALENPGLWLGTVLGELYRQGRDKVTFVPSPGLDKFGYWAEQLLAESTGKAPEPHAENALVPTDGGAGRNVEGRGLVPIEGESIGAPEVYGNDRVFVCLRLDGAENAAMDAKLEELERAGHPILRFLLRDKYALGAEFFRWEFATAVAGALIGINPFDEPNVSESKDNTKRILDEFGEGCALPEFSPLFAQDGLGLYWDHAQDKHDKLDDYLREFMDQTRPGDYIALMAYLTRSPANDKALSAIRTTLRAHYRAATTVGYGPRFLHSTGQLHKGGPNTGIFLQITGDDRSDVNIPGEQYTFGVLKRAQALGDWQSLLNHGRRALRIHLAGETELASLQAVIERAFGQPETQEQAPDRKDGAKAKSPSRKKSAQSSRAKADGNSKSKRATAARAKTTSRGKSNSRTSSRANGKAGQRMGRKTDKRIKKS